MLISVKCGYRVWKYVFKKKWLKFIPKGLPKVVYFEGRATEVPLLKWTIAQREKEDKYKIIQSITNSLISSM